MTREKEEQQSRAGLWAIIGIVVVIVAGALGINIEELTDGSVSEEDLLPSQEVLDWYEIYFTNPTCPPEEERFGGVDETIAEDIRSAEFQVDIATFDLDSEPIIEALIDAEDRGLLVRVVTDNEHNPEGTTNRLRRNGISVIEDQRSALMHNKFIVLDGFVVWTGSLNFTTNGVYCNNNNLVRFEFPELASNYSAEMDEMYNDREFGPTSSRNTTDRLEIQGIEVENYFASEAEVARVVARTIARADQEVLFMAFSFTNEDPMKTSVKPLSNAPTTMLLCVGSLKRSAPTAVLATTTTFAVPKSTTCKYGKMATRV